MAYCPNCGESVRDDQDVCLSCGTELKEKKKEIFEDGSQIGWGILGFFLPLVGLILFLIWRDTKPNASKAAGIGAIIGFILNIVFFSSL
jgi:hypothetical protein